MLDFTTNAILYSSCPSFQLLHLSDIYQRSYSSYLTLSTLCYSILGWPHFLASLGVTFRVEVCRALFFPSCYSWYQWSHHVPETAFAIMYILAVVLFFAVSVMGGYHLLGVAKGETSVEAQDHEIYRIKAKNRGEVCWSTIDFLLCIFSDFSGKEFINSYDLG